MSLSTLWSHLENEWQDVNLIALQGTTIAIDGQIWLYESFKDMETGITDNLLTGFYERCNSLIKLNITPYFVFDQYQCTSLPNTCNNDAARSRSEFQFVRQSRPKVTEGARMRYGRNTVKMKNIHKITELLDAMGIRYFKSRGVDNEAAGSFLEDEGKVIGFVSPDPEYFMYGGKQLYKIQFDSSFAIQSIKKLEAESLEQGSGLTRGRLIALGMLLGCDYSPKKLSGIGIVTALEIVSAFSLHEDDHPCAILDRFRNFYDPTFKAQAEETPPRAKLKQGCYSFDDFNPSSDCFGEAVDAYMWPNLEDLPYEMNRTAGEFNERKVNDILARAIATDDSEDLSDSTEGKKSRKSTISSKGDESSSSLKGSAVVSIGVKRRGTSITSNGVIKKKNVVIPCSRNEAIAWSKREWEAILALRKATTHHINSDTLSSRRSTTISVNAK
ncbi:gen-1 [Pristionchus pacificus]|nr:gen-1 [Pristionchus pacificus]